MADTPPKVDAIRGKVRDQQIQDRVDYETSGGDKPADDSPKFERTDAENDALYKKQRAARQAKPAPETSHRTDPVAYLRGKATDAMEYVADKFKDK